MRNTDLGDQEGLARVTNATDELGEGLIIGLFSLLHQQLRREEASFVPVVHLQT
jgi:c-di-GMP-related signal transduction protein